MKDQIIKSLQKVTGQKDIHLEFPENAEFGDYSTNVALGHPIDFAQKLVQKLVKDSTLMEFVGEIKVAGPGFINFYAKDEVLQKNLGKILKEKENYGKNDLGKGKIVLVEYSSPNIAKRFSIGHLRSTIIGQALYNLYKFQGYRIVGENHMGDWGTQFGMITAQIIRKKLNPQDLSLEDLEKLYVDFNTEMAQNPSLKDEAKFWFKKLEDGDQKARRIWEVAVDVSLKEFQNIWKLLDVKIDYNHGESFYEDKMPAVIEEAKKKGLAQKGERGALIIMLPGTPPGMLIKADGTTTYFTRDLAAIKYRLETWHPDIFIYEVGSEQKLHFRQVFEAARLLGWIKDQKMVHIAHGLVRFKEGKMSTRRGTTIKLEEVLHEAIAKARKFNSDKDISEMVGIGAVKYFDLMHSPQSDIIFDWAKILVLEGNSGPYLQYTYARTQSVLNKAPGTRRKALVPNAYSLMPEELTILRFLPRFSDIIAMSAKSYSPNLLCNYLFELAQKYNTFYNKHKILGSDNEAFRLGLTFGVGQILQTGLTLLGIQAPKKM